MYLTVRCIFVTVCLIINVPHAVLRILVYEIKTTYFDNFDGLIDHHLEFTKKVVIIILKNCKIIK